MEGKLDFVLKAAIILVLALFVSGNEPVMSETLSLTFNRQCGHNYSPRRLENTATILNMVLSIHGQTNSYEVDQFPDQDMCPPGYYSYMESRHTDSARTTGSCYTVGRFSNLSEGQKFCREGGGELVSIETPEESDHLQLATEDIRHSVPYMHAYWTSGVYMTGRETWQWNATGETLTFYNWATGQPFLLLSKHWKHIAIESIKFRWFNSGNEIGHKPICEVKVSFGNDLLQT